MKKPFIELIGLLLFSAACACSQTEPPPPSSPRAASAPSPVEVAPEAASALVVQKASIKYPDAARKAGIQGPVVLRIVTTYSGEVKEVTVVSGDPALAQAAVDAVKQWKYQPYLVEGSPAEIETQVSVNFQITKPGQSAPPPLGMFRDNAYKNDYFDVYYPVSRDWVRETDLMRSTIASEGGSQGKYVLLAAVHIPADTYPLNADSSFTVLAVSRPGAQDCQQYLELLANSVQSHKEAKQKGQISQFSVAGHGFYRADFEYRRGDQRAFLCTAIKDYLLQWNIAGWSKQGIETAVSTLNSMTPVPPTTPSLIPTNAPNHPQQVQVNSGMSTGLLIKQVAPDYPPEAKHAHIQGSVLLRAVINKSGDIAELEIISGPIELVVSAVSAVRKWKYRPYLLNGEPVAVQTTIVVKYVLGF